VWEGASMKRPGEPPAGIGELGVAARIAGRSCYRVKSLSNINFNNTELL